MKHAELRSLAALAAIGALVAPSALAKGKPEKADKPEKVQEAKGKSEQAKGKSDKAKGKAKGKTFIFKGVVTAGASATTVTVDVTGGNSRGKALKGSRTFSLLGAKVNVADTNGDGKSDGLDVKVGDKVVIQAKLTREAAAGTGSLPARKLVDQTAPKADDDEKDEKDEAPVVPVVPAPAG